MKPQKPKTPNPARGQEQPKLVTIRPAQFPKQATPVKVEISEPVKTSEAPIKP